MIDRRRYYENKNRWKVGVVQCKQKIQTATDLLVLSKEVVNWYIRWMDM